jgi:hypothetical protein
VSSEKREGFMEAETVGLTVLVKVGNDVGNMEGTTDGSNLGTEDSGEEVSDGWLGRSLGIKLGQSGG